MNSKNVLLFFIFLLLACCQNNEELNSNSKLKVLEKNIEIINNHPPEYDPNDTLDIISFTENTTKVIVDLINESNINPDSIKGLNKTIDFGHLKTYSYGYWSGGTRGFVTYSILTYENNNEHHAANLSRNVKARFESLIKLDSISYLLLGADKAWSSTYSNIAYFIRLSNDKIDINYPAFVNRPYLNFYNGTYEYDTTTNILKFQGEQAEPIHEVFNSKEKYGEFAKDSVSSRKLFEMIEGFEYYDNKNRFFLKYNGKNFERISNGVTGKYAVIMNTLPNDTLGYLNIYADSTYFYEVLKSNNISENENYKNSDCEEKGQPYFFCHTNGKYLINEKENWIDFNPLGQDTNYPRKDAISRKFLIRKGYALKYTASRSFEAYKIIKVYPVL